MTVWHWVAVISTAIAILPIVMGTIFVIGQLITYAYLTAKYRFEQSHKPKEHLDNGHDQQA